MDKHDIRPDPRKVEAIKDVQPPQNTTELKHVMGMVHFLGRYLPNLADVTHPLNDPLKADKAWVWGPAQNKAFTDMKQLLTEAPILAFYDVNKQTVVSADASSYWPGGVLLKDHNGHLKPVAYC